MKTKLLLLSILLITFVIENSYSQVSVANNTWVTGDYVGWSSANPILFQTNSTTHMTLFDGTGSPFNAGFVGIGNATPRSMFLLRRVSPRIGFALRGHGGNMNATLNIDN